MSVTVNSKSTDKLQILMDGLQNIPREKMHQLDYFEINWIEVDSIVVPNVILKFKDGEQKI